MKLGRNLARTFLDYYKMTGYISAKPSSSMLPKPGANKPRPDRRDRTAADRDGYGGVVTERSTSEPLQRSSQMSDVGGGGQFGGRWVSARGGGVDRGGRVDRGGWVGAWGGAS